jgi:hypothetical protein
VLEVVAGILLRCGQLFEDVQQLCVYVCTVSCPMGHVNTTVANPQIVGHIAVICQHTGPTTSGCMTILLCRNITSDLCTRSSVVLRTCVCDIPINSCAVIYTCLCE